MRKDKVDIRRYRDVGVADLRVDGDATTIEFRERWDKRVVLTLKDWQVRHLVKRLGELPAKRAEELGWIRAAFAESASEEPRP